MKVEVIIEIALAAVLAIYGGHLAKESRTLDLAASARRSFVSANQRIAVVSVTGIDPAGNLVNRVIIPGTKRFVVFGLRKSTLQSDLSLWTSVAALLPKNSGARLVGFCDGSACAEAVRTAYPSLAFPVIAYGDPPTSQAILREDAQGNFILLNGALSTLGRVQWRQSNLTPSTIVREALP